ncbi:MAG: hypothetical protein QM690_14780 [Sphingobium sp.]
MRPASSSPFPISPKSCAGAKAMIHDVVKQGSEWLRNVPARAALRYCNRPDVRARMGLRHEAALARHRPRIPELIPADRAIVDQLDRRGVAVTSIHALGLAGGDGMVDIAAGLARRFTARAHGEWASGKPFIIVPPGDIVGAPAIFHWGLHDRLLDIAEAYIGLPAAYDGVAINYTVADGREISTRKWHQDWEDRRMLKVAVYLHDVDEDGGPFQVVARGDMRQSDRNGYSYELADDAELARRLGQDYRRDIMSCTGARGTVIFADTARLFHRGKPATARDRAALFYSYFAQAPRHPFYCERTGMRRRDLYRLAEDLPRRQREAVMWRRRIALPLRIIPPATL